MTAWASVGVAVALFATCLIVPRVGPPAEFIGRDGATIIFLAMSLPIFGMTLGLALGAVKGRMVIFTIAGTVIGSLALAALIAKVPAGFF